MKEALVEYIGKRRGKFPIRMERYPIREWSIAPRAGIKERWLPIDEAELWAQQKHWMITRIRVTPVETKASVKLAEPAPPAKHVSVLLEKKTTAQEQQQHEFCISDNGVVHKRGCRVWPKHPLKTFDTFADAMNDEDFGKAHRFCCGAVRQPTKLEKTLKEVEGGLAQMNVLGESYGIQATEA